MRTRGPEKPWDLIVVGGGLEGLTAAWAHATAGRRVLVLEARERIGGRNKTTNAEGFLLEEDLPHLPLRVRPLVDAVLGTDALATSRAPVALAGLLGERGRIRPPGSLSPRRLIAGLAPIPRLPRLPPTAARMTHHAVEPLAFMEAATRATFGVAATSVGAGDAFPAAVAVQARHPRRPLPLALLHPCLDANAALVPGGSSRLAEALASSDEVRVETNQAVVAIESGDDVVVSTRDAAYRAPRLLLAIEAAEQARLLRPHDPMSAELLTAIPQGSRVTLHLGLSAASARRLPRRLGILSIDRRLARLRGAAFVSLLDKARAPRGEALVQAWFGDGREEDFTAYDDALLLRIARTDLERALGFAPDVTFHRVTRRPSAHPIPVPGLRGRLARAQASLAGRGIGLLGRHMRGVDLGSRLGIHVLRTRPRPAGL